MEPTAELLAKAKLEAEQLYGTWRSVSLARLASDGELEVTTQDGARIIFGTNQDFFRQLANLDAILEVAKTRPDKALRVINLALGGDVPVTFDGATPQDPADPSAAVVPIRAAVSPALRLNGFNP
jgi:cell division protein FtsQ